MKRTCLTILFILLFTICSRSADLPAARFGGSPGLPELYLQRALSLFNSDQFIEGAMYLQQIIQSFPGSEQATQAKELNTLVYRLHLAPPTDNRTYQPDNTFGASISEIDEPTGLGIDSKQNLYYADKDKKSLTVFDATGKVVNSSSLLSPFNISINDKDQVLVADNDNAVLGSQTFFFSVSDSKGSAQNIQEIRSVAMDTTGKYYVVSNKLPGIFVFDNNKSQIKNSPLSSGDKQYYKVLVNGKNQVLALDKDRKQIVIFNSDGTIVSTIGPTGKGYQIERIEDFAIDPLNHVYILEKNPRSVLIFSSSGSLLKFFLSDKKSTVAFEDARLIAVGRSGSVYLLDKDSHRILKIG
jgi:hypothetical protein